MESTVKEPLKQAGWRLFLNLVPCDAEDTIVIAGVARSGTSWLAELLQTLREYKLLGEPLAYGLGRPDHRPLHLEPHESTRHRRDIEVMLEGRRPGGWRLGTDSKIRRLFRHVRRRKLVVKFVHGNRLLQWIDRHFEVRKIILIIRHPCAVVASMQKYGAWYYATPNKASPSLDDIEEGLSSGLAEEVRHRLPRVPESKEEILALRWALDHYIPFFVHEDAGYPWTLVPYERLVANGEDELTRIFGDLGEAVPEAAKQRLRTASRSAQRTGAYTDDAKNQLSKWRRRLSTDQVDRILRIAHAFDLDFYGGALEAEYSRLMDFQSPDAPIVQEGRGVSRHE